MFLFSLSTDGIADLDDLLAKQNEAESPDSISHNMHTPSNGKNIYDRAERKAYEEYLENLKSFSDSPDYAERKYDYRLYDINRMKEESKKSLKNRVVNYLTLSWQLLHEDTRGGITYFIVFAVILLGVIAYGNFTNGFPVLPALGYAAIELLFYTFCILTIIFVHRLFKRTVKTTSTVFYISWIIAAISANIYLAMGFMPPLEDIVWLCILLAPIILILTSKLFTVKKKEHSDKSTNIQKRNSVRFTKLKNILIALVLILCFVVMFFSLLEILV